MKYFDLRFLLIVLFIGGLSCSSNHFRTTDDVSPSQTRKNILKAQDSFILLKIFDSKMMYATGSGFIIKSDGDGSYVMTAAHVCLMPLAIKERTGIQNIKLELQTLNRQKGYNPKIHHIDVEHDLCILYTKNIKNASSIEISNYQIEKGAEIYAISAPRGITYLKYETVPFYRGFFLGQKSDTEDIYSLRISYGSSGGMIVSKKGEVVGLIQSKLAFNDRDKFDALTISPSYKEVKKAYMSVQ